MVVYSAGTGVVPKGRCRWIKPSFPTIAMHVDAVFMFAWMRWYASSRSIFPIRMCFEGYLMYMATTMWSILRSQNSYKHSCRVSLSTWFFTDGPEGPGKDKSWVTCLLV